jgi:hypothetical protein
MPNMVDDLDARAAPQRTAVRTWREDSDLINKVKLSFSFEHALEPMQQFGHISSSGPE